MHALASLVAESITKLSGFWLAFTVFDAMMLWFAESLLVGRASLDFDEMTGEQVATATQDHTGLAYGLLAFVCLRWVVMFVVLMRTRKPVDKPKE